MQETKINNDKNVKVTPKPKPKKKKERGQKIKSRYQKSKKAQNIT